MQFSQANKYAFNGMSENQPRSIEIAQVRNGFLKPPSLDQLVV